MSSFIGQSIKRVEDKRFLTGQGKYTDDIVLPGMTYAYIVVVPMRMQKSILLIFLLLRLLLVL